MLLVFWRHKLVTFCVVLALDTFAVLYLSANIRIPCNESDGSDVNFHGAMEHAQVPFTNTSPIYKLQKAMDFESQHTYNESIKMIRLINESDFLVPPPDNVKDVSIVANKSGLEISPYLQTLIHRLRRMLVRRMAVSEIVHLNHVTSWEEIREHPGILRNVNLMREETHAISGGPLAPLTTLYKNPCWISKLPLKDDLYPYNPFFYKMRNVDTGYEGFMKRWQAEYNQLKAEGVTTRIRCMPYFYVAGVTKSGTTALCSVLRLHPNVSQSGTKETMYWNRLRLGPTSKRIDFHDYIDTFDDLGLRLRKGSNQKITFDGSPSYTWDFYRWKSIEANRHKKEPLLVQAHSLRAIYPPAKIIILLRRPVDRVFSQFRMWQGSEKWSVQYFHEKVLDAVENYTKCLENHSLRSCLYGWVPCGSPMLANGRVCRFVGASMYFVHVRDWLAVFPRDQVLVLKSEELATAGHRVVQDTLDFLGAGSMSMEQSAFLQGQRHINKNSTMLPETRILLERFYEPFNQELAKMLGDKKWLWED